MLHIDRANITTKSNCTYEIVSLALIIIINEVIRPQHLTMAPSENYIAMMRYLCREFTVSYIIYIVNKLIIFQVVISNGDLKSARSTQAKG